MNLLNGKIRVYNYEKSPVGFPSNVIKNGVFIKGREDNEEYTMARVLWEDVEEENTNSDLFRTGVLRFNPEEEDEIYKKLGIDDKENIKSNKDIINMLSDTKLENLKKINDIKSPNLITRMKMTLFSMEKAGKNVPLNIITVINEKYDEIRYHGKTNKKGYVDKLIEKENKDKQDNKVTDQLNKLSEEVKNLRKEKEESESKSKESLSDLLKMVQDLKSENETLKKNISANDDSDNSKKVKSNKKKQDEVVEEKTDNSKK